MIKFLECIFAHIDVLILDSECPDICALGGCSFRCSRDYSCPDGYTCMSGRCYVTCVWSLNLSESGHFLLDPKFRFFICMSKILRFFPLVDDQFLANSHHPSFQISNPDTAMLCLKTYISMSHQYR